MSDVNVHFCIHYKGDMQSVWQVLLYLEMNLLFTGYLLQLLVYVSFFSINEVKAYENYIYNLDSIGQEEANFNTTDTLLPSSGQMKEETFDLLFDVGQNRNLLKSQKFRTALAETLVYEGKIKEFVAIDSYIFHQTGLENDLIQVLEDASRLASRLPDNNNKFFYLCLIDASIAGLKTSITDQMLWYASAYRHHTLIEEDVEEFKKTKLVGLVSHAMTFSLSNKIEQANERFLYGVSHIDHDEVREDDYYLLFKYINFQIELKSYDDVEKWLRYTLSLAHKHDDEYYKTLSYYHLMLLKTKQGAPDAAAKYQAYYQDSKKKLNVKDLIKITFTENSYYEVTNSMFKYGGNGVIIFAILTVLLVGGLLGASVYVHYNTKRSKIALANEEGTVELVQAEAGKQKERDEGESPIDRKEKVVEPHVVTVEDINYLKKLAESNDPLFIKKFKECFVDFAGCLDEKSETPLNLAELEVCAYTKLGYTTKEVAYYRGDSIRSVENRKYRIRRKLNLPSDIDFTDWFLSM